MTDVDWMKHWQQLYEEVYFVCGDQDRNREKPTDQHLDRFQEKLAVRLPVSYRAFIKVFGPGFIARSFPIYSPGYRGAGVVDMLANNKWQDEYTAHGPEPEKYRRCIAFSECAYQLIVWDTGDVTDPYGPEYRILRLPRHYEPLIPVTDSFRAFIEEFCLGGKYLEMLGGVQEETWADDDTGAIHSIRCFDPVGGAPKSKF